MMHSRLLLSAATVLLVSAFCASGRADDDNDLGPDVDPVKFSKWLDNLKAAIKKNDKVAVSKMIDSPLSVSYGDDYDDYTGKRSKGYCRTFNQRAFLASYDKIFTHDLQKKLLSLRKSDIWANSHGICFAQGVMWINPVNKVAFKITSISFDIIPPDTDLLLQKVNDAAKSTPTDNIKLAALYSALAHGYDDNWRVIPEGNDSVVVELKKKEEAAFKKAISLRQGAAAKSQEQAKDLQQLAKLIAIGDDRKSEALKLYQQLYALQKATLPHSSAPLVKTTGDIARLKKDMSTAISSKEPKE